MMPSKSVLRTIMPYAMVAKACHGVHRDANSDAQILGRGLQTVLITGAAVLLTIC